MSQEEDGEKLFESYKTVVCAAIRANIDIDRIEVLQDTNDDMSI